MERTDSPLHSTKSVQVIAQYELLVSKNSRPLPATLSKPCKGMESGLEGEGLFCVSELSSSCGSTQEIAGGWCTLSCVLRGGALEEVHAQGHVRVHCQVGHGVPQGLRSISFVALAPSLISSVVTV